MSLPVRIEAYAKFAAALKAGGRRQLDISEEGDENLYPSTSSTTGTAVVQDVSIPLIWSAYGPSVPVSSRLSSEEMTRFEGSSPNMIVAAVGPIISVVHHVAMLQTRNEQVQAAIRNVLGWTQTSGATFEGVDSSAIAFSSSPQSFPFAVLEDPRVHDNQLESLIAQIRASSKLRYRDKLAARITELVTIFEEEKSEGCEISFEALHSFIDFLEKNSQLRYPKLALTRNGNIYAQWCVSNEKLFSIQFHPDGNATFVIFRPNSRHRGKVVRISGIVTTDMIMETVLPHNVLEWAAE